MKILPFSFIGENSYPSIFENLSQSHFFTTSNFAYKEWNWLGQGLARNNRRLLFYRRCPTVPLLPLVLLAIFGDVDFPRSYGIKQHFFEQRILPFFQENITIFSREYYHFFFFRIKSYNLRT